MAIILFGALHFAYFMNFALSAERAEATITQSVYVPAQPRTGRYSSGLRSGHELTITFTDHVGTAHNARIVSRSIRPTARGRQISILYHPDSPESAIENSWRQTWGVGLIFMLAGYLFWRGSIFGIIYQYKNKSNAK